MRKILIVLVLTALMLQGASVGLNINKFGDGSSSSTSGTEGAGVSTTVNINVPAECHVLSATVSISTATPNETYPGYPEGVGLFLEGAPIWQFNGTGFGAFGNQSAFANGTALWKSQFGDQGGSNSTMIRLPKKAVVQSARFSVNCSGPEGKLASLINITGNSSGPIANSLSSAGDVNGDGYDDIISGSYDTANIYFGGPAMDGVADIFIPKPSGANSFGCSVSSAGDVNKDGYDDVVVGARYCSDENGRAYIFLGGANMDSTPDFSMTGAARWDWFGRSVAGAGDVNGDGYDDVLVGANGNDEAGPEAGRVYLYLGGAAMDAVVDLVIPGTGSYQELGGSVSGAGDVNKDGYDDVILGTGGEANIYLGGKNMDNKADFVLTADGGNVVSSAGDVNGDGYSDVLIGAPAWGSGITYPGSASLYLGGAPMDTTPDLVIRGESGNDVFGGSVSGAGDVDQDGFADFIVGAPNHDVVAANDGKAYFFYGGSPPDGQPDFTLEGQGDQTCLGGSVSGDCDLDGDGNADFVIGAAGDDTGGSNVGALFIYRGVAGVSKPAISVGQTQAWKLSASLNRTWVSSNIAAAFNSHLGSASPSGTDAYGNSFVDVPFQVSASSKGTATVSVFNLTYTYVAPSPDFSAGLNGYIANHKAEKDSSGNLTVPLEIETRTSGRVKLLNLSIVADLPPGLTQPVPDMTLDEDSSIAQLVDLQQYFKDDFDTPDRLNYTLVSATNSTIVPVAIVDNRYISADAATGPQNDNWTGSVQITVSAADRWGMKVHSNPFNVSVTNVPDAPQITSLPPLNGTIARMYTYQITASDGDGDLLTFGLSQGPDTMTVIPATGLMEWTPRSSGLYPVTATVTDGTFTASQDFSISVPPPPNRPPRVENATVPDAWTDQPFTFSIPARDDDGDSLGFALVTSVDTLTVGPLTGVVSWTPHQAGAFPVSVNISDGKDSLVYTFTINVRQGNRAPVFSGVPTATATVDVPYTSTAGATDADGDIPTYSKESGPANLTVAASSGAVSWTPDVPGTFAVILKVSDGKGGEARLQFNITVSAAVKPKITYSGPASGQKVKGSLVLTGNITKGTREVQKVQISIDGGNWTKAAGTYDWSCTVDTTPLKNGPHTFAIRAFDGKEYSEVSNVSLTVDNPKASTPTGKGFIPMMDGVVAEALCVSVMVFLALGRRRRI
jgi:hypothetical protein